MYWGSAVQLIFKYNFVHTMSMLGRVRTLEYTRAQTSECTLRYTSGYQGYTKACRDAH